MDIPTFCHVVLNHYAISWLEVIRGGPPLPPGKLLLLELPVLNELVMVNDIEGIAEVNAKQTRTFGWFTLIKAIRHRIRQRKEGSDG